MSTIYIPTGGVDGALRVRAPKPKARTQAIIVTPYSNKVGFALATIYAGAPSSLGFGVGGQSYSNFLASTVVNRVF